MNKLTTLFCSLLAGLVFQTAASGQSRFSIAPTFALGQRHFNFTSQFPGSDSRLIGSSTYQGFSAGVTTHYAFSPNWSVSVGLLYNRFKGNDDYESISGVTSTRSSATGRYESIQLPVLLNYTVSTRRLSPYLSAGVLVNYNYRDTFSTTVGGSIATIQNNRKIDDPRAVLVQPMIGIGVQYRFTPAISLIVQPTATYEVGKPGTYYTTFRNYQVGLQTQLRFTL